VGVSTTGFGRGGLRSTRAWSLAALALSVAGFALSVAVVFGPGQDPSRVRWPLVAAPLVAAALSLVVPRRGVRIAAAVVMALWCALAAASVGVFFVPATVAAAVAAWREDAS